MIDITLDDGTILDIETDDPAQANAAAWNYLTERAGAQSATSPYPPEFMLPQQPGAALAFAAPTHDAPAVNASGTTRAAAIDEGEDDAPLWQRAVKQSRLSDDRRAMLRHELGPDAQSLSDEQMYALLARHADEKSGPGQTILIQARRMLGDDGWRAFMAAKLRSTGRNDPKADFDPAGFRAGWGGLSDNFKVQLAPEHRKAIDALDAAGRATGADGAPAPDPLALLQNQMGGNLVARWIAWPTASPAVARWAREVELASRLPSERAARMQAFANVTLANAVAHVSGDDPAAIRARLDAGLPAEAIAAADDPFERAAARRRGPIGLRPGRTEVSSPSDQPLTSVPGKPTVPQWLAAFEGALSGASGNLRDEAFGLAQASGLPHWMNGIRIPVGAVRLGYEWLTGQDKPTLKDLSDITEGAAPRQPAIDVYRSGRDVIREIHKAAEEQHPGTFLASNVGGGAVLPVGNILKAATVPAQMKRGALFGAGYGGLSGFGAGEGLEDSLWNIPVGAGLGAAAGYAAPRVIEAITDGAKAMATHVGHAWRGRGAPPAEAARRVAPELGRDATPGPTPTNLNPSSSAAPDEFEAVTARARSPASLPGRREAITAVNLRSLPFDEALAVAQSERHIIPKASGGYVGAPKWVQTPRDFTKMRDHFDAWVAEGLWAADSSARVQAFIREVAGPNPAKQSLAARELALTAQRTTPETNLGFTIDLHNAYEAGMPLQMSRTGRIARVHKEARDSAADIPLGKKTAVYADDIDPTRASPTTGTNDIWQARAFGYRCTSDQRCASFTPQQHAFMDAEVILATNRANQRQLGGRSTWTPGEVHSAVFGAGKARGLEERFDWDPQRARAEANKTYIDYLDKHTASGIYKMTPDAGIGHLPQLVGGPAAERAKFVHDSRSSWQGPDGRDILYDAQGMYVRPTIEATSIYRMSGSPLEGIPTHVARPLVAFAGATGERTVHPRDMAAMRAIEGFRAVLDARNLGRASVPILGQKAGRSTELVLGTTAPLSIEQLALLKQLGAKHGFPDVTDYGQGVMMTSFWKTPTPAELNNAIKAGMIDEVKAIVGDVPIHRSHLALATADFRGKWGREQGSGAVTRELQKLIDDPQTPGLMKKLDADPRVRAKAVALIERDAEIALQTGQPIRDDLMNLRLIVAKDGLEGLFAAVERREFVPAVALAPLAPLFAEALDRGE
jgi:hypothetical protein